MIQSPAWTQQSPNSQPFVCTLHRADERKSCTSVHLQNTEQLVRNKNGIKKKNNYNNKNQQEQE